MVEDNLTVEQQRYFENLQVQVDEIYEIAQACRAKGHDPRSVVEIPQASDMASRVQQLLEFLHQRDTAEQIRSLILKHEGDREQVAIEIALTVCMESTVGEYSLSQKVLKQKFSAMKKSKTPIDVANAIYHGICVGLAVITEGILVAPLEGVVSCEILTNADNSKCLSVNYAGPIRSAGGTGQAISVLLADYLRREFDLGTPIMEENEVERYIEEVMLYHSLQYKPTADEMRSICQSVPIYITGEGVGKEVSGGRDLKRVSTTRVREGMLLVLCEGMLLKAPKLKKHTDRLKLDSWGFLDAYCHQAKDESMIVEFKPKSKYIADSVAGRPTFSQPMTAGGFRLRYGRSRAAGLAATAIHPASMFATGGFITAATQMKIERPGKATVVSPCTEIDGPYVQFIDGSACRFNDIDTITAACEGKSLLTSSKVAKVWDLGDLLIPAGEFRENNHPLMPSPYVHEWHEQTLEQLNLLYPSTFDEALEQSKKYSIPMAPEYSCFFSDVSAQELLTLMNGIQFDMCKGKATITEDVIEVAYRLCVDIERTTKDFVINNPSSSVLLNNCLAGVGFKGSVEGLNGLELINQLADYEVRPRVTYRIGTRMAKPEKVSRREMKPPIHGLIPIGHDIHSRLITDAVNKVRKPLQIGWRYCADCVKQDIKPDAIREEVKAGKPSPSWLTIDTTCAKCDTSTTFLYTPSWGDPKTSQPLYEFKEKWDEAVTLTGYRTNKLKGVKGMTSREKIPEHMAKALLRHKHRLSVFRDGTIRFDMCDMTLTHFKPQEIGLSIEQAKELGYTHDKDGNPLIDKTQVVEMKIQDFVAPLSLKEELLNTSRFTDELMIRLYGHTPYYSCTTGDDLIGHLFATLAPHTSGAILCRLIGYANIKGGYFHPYSIAGRRRNSDGDIDSIILLTECLLNFSRTYLSSNRGGQMDAPLILTTRINPSEIDKEALNVDTSSSYSLEFYEATLKRISAKEIGDYTEFVEHRIGEPQQYEGLAYTHCTEDISLGPKSNPYTALANMKEKVSAQFKLGELLIGVDNKDQSSRLLDRHLLRDMRGNIRAFGQQKVRCMKCNYIYRRPPLTRSCRQVTDRKLIRVCPKCGHYHKQESSNCESCKSTLNVEEVCNGNLTLTIYPASVKKYQQLMTELIADYGCNEYDAQKFHMFVEWLDDLFDAGSKQTSLTGLFDE